MFNILLREQGALQAETNDDRYQPKNMLGQEGHKSNMGAIDLDDDESLADVAGIDLDDLSDLEPITEEGKASQAKYQELLKKKKLIVD